MERKKHFDILLLIGCLIAPLSSVLAHDPGLSRSSVQLQNSELDIQMSFARQDLEGLASIDADHDGSVTADEFSTIRPQLQSRMMNAVTVKQAGEIVLSKSVHVEQAPDDAVIVELVYDYSPASAVTLQLPLIAQLARGHRQYLVAQDESGNLLAQHILDANMPLIILNEGGPGGFSVFREYLVEGVWHIWIGFDHILFLLTLLLPAVLVYRNAQWQSQENLRPAMTDILKVVTAFTVAHSITLALAVLDIVSLPTRLVESVIAFSVLVTAVNNLRPVFPASRWLLAFAFGLVHGFGFATVLIDLGLPGHALLISLLGFNLGVEAGQLAIVACVFPLAAFMRHSSLYRTWIFSGGSTVAALIAMVWIFERLFDYEVLGY